MQVEVAVLQVGREKGKGEERGTGDPTEQGRRLEFPL